MFFNQHLNPAIFQMTAESEIRRRIGQSGAITFAEFMDLALYWPGGGYYVTGDPTGPQGDFYTSPQAHPVFGALLAVQLFQMWRLLEQPDPFTVVETGAGNGLLCRDILAAAVALPAPFFACLDYVCLDRRLFPGLEDALPESQENASAHRVAAAGIPFRPLVGCLVSNEYFDSFPVHQVSVAEGKLVEIYITLEGGEMVTKTGELSDPALAARFDSLGLELEEGQTAEVNLGLDGWFQEAAQSLERGFILTVDYGDPAPELYSADKRFRGTLTTFFNHVQLDSPLRHVGRQDITAQVDFTSLANAGWAHGIKTVGLAPQRQFLGRLGLERMQQRLRSLPLPQHASQANQAGMLDLARPGGLGDFKVMAQGKGVGKPELWGFTESKTAHGEAAAIVDGIPVPLLTGQHLSRLQGRYPGGELEIDLENLFEGPGPG